jgi:hypothetical protein
LVSIDETELAMKTDQVDPVRGRTIRLSWSEGPTQGTTQEHVFHDDGTVEWHSVGADAKKADPASGAERPRYAASTLADGVALVSYLSKSGYTLTVALRFDDRSTIGFASNDKSWFPVRGTFEVVG